MEKLIRFKTLSKNFHMNYSYALCFALVVLSLYGDAKGQIVGGTMAENGTFNFLVKLDLYYAVENTENIIPAPLLCGGTIIDWNWIMTAAHCFRDHKEGQVNTKWKRVDVIAGVKDALDPRRQVQTVGDKDRW